MTLASGHSLRQTAKVDVVGDRDKLIFVGMAAVFAACLAFGTARLVLTLGAGALTPWWANLGGAVAMLTLYLWYRRRPRERSAQAAHGTALVATLALLVPVVYGMSSTIWWLGLVGFAMVLLGRQREAWVWGLVIPLVITGAVLAEPSVQLEGAVGENGFERGMAKIAFALVLVSMAAAFRGLAERRARELHDSEERHRNLFDRAPVGIVHYDKEMHITDCNGRFASILGSDRERLVGLDLGSLEDQRVLPALQVALSGGQGEYDGPFDSGTTRVGIFLSIRTAPLHGKNSAVVGAIGILEDVTARRRAEDELRRSQNELEDRVQERTEELRQLNLTLRKSEERYRLIAENTADVIWTLDLATGRFTYVSPSIQKLTGFTPEEFMARPFQDSVTRESLPHVEAQLKASLAAIAAGDESARTATIEVEEPTKDGGTVPTELVATAISLPNGEVATILGVTRDRSERKRAEEALRESEERYRSLFEQSPIGIYRTTPDGRILLANPALLHMLGYDSSEELMARNLETTGFEQEYPRERFKEMLERDNEVRGFETLWTTRSGDRVRVIENARAIRGLDGRILYYEGTVENITARRRAEEAQHRLAAAVEQGDEAVIITNPDGTIEYVNPAFQRITGYSSDEAVGRTPRLLNSGSHDATFYKAMWDTITAGKVWSGHLINRRKDGSKYEEETTISPVRDPDGKIVNFVAVKRDVTHEVALQQQLNQAQKMDAIGRLAGGIAHDFNNLLQASLSHAQMLRTHADDPERVRTEAAELEQHTLRGAGLTRQLLLFARRETAKSEHLDLNDVTQAAATMLRRLVRENVVFDLELADAPVMVEADHGQLEQVLMNLVVNASDAMPSGGRLIIRTGCDLATSSWLEVEDTGHGIPETIREHILEPFFTTKEAGKGTGLGLSVVHGIVTRHGGRVELETHEGQGSKFRVVLPRSGPSKSVPVETPPAVPSKLAVGHGERVLVVEDEEGPREGLKEILTLLGYETVAVGSGTEAGLLAAEPRFALLLTDLMLPDVAGHDLAGSLQGRWPELAVVFMSGYAEDEALRRGIETGHVRFLQKPFNMQTLANAIRAALDERLEGR